MAATTTTSAFGPVNVFGPKVQLRRIRINRQGYDASGHYWGVGQPLFWLAAENGVFEEHFRADDREHAKQTALGKHGPLRFYR